MSHPSPFVEQPAVELADGDAINVRAYVQGENSTVDISVGVGSWPNRLRLEFALLPATAERFIQSYRAALDVVYSHHPELRPPTEPVIPSEEVAPAPVLYDDPQFADTAGPVAPTAEPAKAEPFDPDTMPF